MNSKFLLFLAIVAILVTGLVIFEINRDNPWDSDVFFGQNGDQPIYEQSFYSLEYFS